MFSRDRDAGERRSSTGAPSILSEGMRVTGDIISDGEVQIDGDLVGDIRCAKLTVGATGHIKGAVVADYCFIHGSVIGQIQADSVELSRSSRVEGDVLHDSLAIEPGARLDGHCRRLEPQHDDKLVDLVVPDAGLESSAR